MKSFMCRVVLLCSLFLLPGAVAQAVPPGWGIGASVSTPRDWHSATLLQDGSVLIAGGYASGTGATNKAERYIPAANAWLPVGDMVYERRQHAAALLADGKVLVVGGRDRHGVALGSAELYDPATGTWRQVGGLTTPRSDPTATLLPDGKVLVTGGAAPSALTNAVEIFDPGKTAFDAGPSMLTGRAGHAATALPGGNVLITGGQLNGTGAPSGVQVERYDWARKEWQAVPGMNVARAWHRASLLNDGRVLVSGGHNGSAFVNSAEVLNAGLTAWSATAPMGTARGYHTSTTMHSGRVLVTGGDNAGGLADQSTEIYNPATNAWTSAGNMTLARHAQTSTLLHDGRVLIASGWSQALAYAAPSEIWTPSTTLLADPAVSFDDTMPGAAGGAVAHITNTGDSPLLVSNLALGGSFGGDYAITSNGCAGAVPAGGACAIGLRFAPGATGARGATLTFEANTPTLTHGVSLIGRGVAAAAVPAATPSRIVVTLAYRYSGVTSKATKLTGLTVKGVPQGATVTVTCKKGCASKRYVKRNARGNVKISAIHKTKRLKAGTRITVTVTKPGMVTAVKTLTIRKRKPPLVR